jgi:hypothetical protein
MMALSDHFPSPISRKFVGEQHWPRPIDSNQLNIALDSNV